MYVVDTNILIYAADKNCEEHTICFKLLEDIRREILPWFLTWSIIYEFLRVSTHPRVFRKPLKINDSINFMKALLSSTGLKVLTETQNHAQLLTDTLIEVKGIKGNKLHDTHIAVIMREHGISKIYTRDNDFHIFSFIEVIDPLK